MKKAFSLILAIIFIIAIASIGALSLSISSAGSSTTAKQFMREQAELLSQGAAEYTILRVQQNDFAAQCINKIEIKYPNADNPTFISSVYITYIGNNDLLNKGTPACTKVINDTSGDPSKIKAIIIQGRTCSTTDGKTCDEQVAHSFNTTQIP